jgi:hypothetical protein
MPKGATFLIAGLWLLLGSAICATPEDLFPSYLQSMNPQELTRFCADWDALLRTDAVQCGGRLLPDLLVLCKDTPYGQVHIFRYIDESIRQRVLALYIAEYQYGLSRSIQAAEKANRAHATEEQVSLWDRTREREQRMLAQSIERHTNLFDGLAMNPAWRKEGEREFEYLSLLATAAESILDPKIYEEVWAFPTAGAFHVGYLVETDPVRTTKELVTAAAGLTSNGRKYAQDSLFRRNNGMSISISTAFDVMQRICERYPSLAKEQANDVRAFTQRYALHFAPNGKTDYREVGDFMLRQATLRILAQVGNCDDIEFVHRLAKNPPEKRPPSFRKVVQDKRSIAESAANAISMIEARSKPGE